MKNIVRAHLLLLSIPLIPRVGVAEVTELPSIAPTEVYISNTSSTHTVNFRVIGSNCPQPLDVSLRPDHYGTYSCDGAANFSFSITTAMQDGSKVPRTATLQPTRRYEVFSDASGVWSIREVTAR